MTYLSIYINRENNRQDSNIELIASENFVSDNILKAVGSNLTNKYAEGYPNAESISLFQETYPDYIHTGKVGRYYGGCEEIDQVELYCRYLWQKVFKTNYHVNVQPHSGSSANMAAYMAVLKPGDTILSLSLNDGGHLTHGSKVSFSGKTYNFIHYGLTEEGFIDYNDLAEKIKLHKPQLILAGASAYSREIDFEKIYNLIQEEKTEDYNPYFMVDMAHIAGLVAAEEHQSPFGYADIITTTTHKTLRGPRSGLIFCRPSFADRIDAAVFPGCQGGPLLHVIAGKAVCAEEALDLSFKEYIIQVKKNAKAMSECFKSLGYSIVSNGTDNHMFLLDLTDKNITGLKLQTLLDEEDITLNKNNIPNDPLPPSQSSGVRIGTAAMTTKGWKEEQFIRCAYLIDHIIKENTINEIDN